MDDGMVYRSDLRAHFPILYSNERAPIVQTVTRGWNWVFVLALGSALSVHTVIAYGIYLLWR